MTLNLNYYSNNHGDWQYRKHLIADVISANKPDLIAFQAVARNPEIDGGIDQAFQIAHLVDDYPHRAFHPAEVFPAEGVQGSAILSRYPFIEIGQLKLSLLPDLEDRNHRIVLHACVDHGDGAIDLFNTHFSWVTDQVRRNVAEALPFFNAARNPALVVGDFNMTPDSPDLQQIHATGWIDVWKRFHPNEPGFTFESNAPSMRIDYALANSSLAPYLQTIELLRGGPNSRNARLSDHLGLLITLTTPP